MFISDFIFNVIHLYLVIKDLFYDVLTFVFIVNNTTIKINDYSNFYISNRRNYI